MTLAFLGDVPSVPAVAEALATVPPWPPIPMRLSGAGIFGGRVTWTGVEGDVPPLRDAVRAALLPILPPASPLVTEARPYAPHLTVAYATSPELTAALTGYRGPPWQAREFTLVHSQGGYHRLRSYPGADQSRSSPAI